MRTIWKFPLQEIDRQAIEMPDMATILTVQVQNGTPTIWAEVFTSLPIVSRIFEIFGTGHIIPAVEYKRKYIGTYQQHGGTLVFYVYEAELSSL